MKTKIQLGATYKDKLTGLKGIAIAHIEYLTGCHQTQLQPKLDKDGASQAAEWIDDQRAERQGDPVVQLNNDVTPDGPAPVIPPRHP